MRRISNIASLVVLLGISTILGFLGKVAEMGLATTAGFLGLVFSNLEQFSRFKGGGFEAEMREKLEGVVEKEIEPDVKLGAAQAEGYALVGDEPPKVIRALNGSRYAWRYVSGISRDSGVPRDKVQTTLDWLEENALAKATSGKTGKIWALTTKGREVFAEYRS